MLARWLPPSANARNRVSFTEKKPISAAEITAERATRLRRMRKSIYALRELRDASRHERQASSRLEEVGSDPRHEERLGPPSSMDHSYHTHFGLGKDGE